MQRVSEKRFHQKTDPTPHTIHVIPQPGQHCFSDVDACCRVGGAGDDAVDFSIAAKRGD